MISLNLNDESKEFSKEPINESKPKMIVRKFITTFLHSKQCKIPDCKSDACKMMKRLVSHFQGCQIKISGKCYNCRQVFQILCYHAYHCEEKNCPLPKCLTLKNEILKKE